MIHICTKKGCPKRIAIGSEKDEDSIRMMCPNCNEIYYTSDKRRKNILLIIPFVLLALTGLNFRNEIGSSLNGIGQYFKKLREKSLLQNPKPNSNEPDTTSVVSIDTIQTEKGKPGQPTLVGPIDKPTKIKEQPTIADEGKGSVGFKGTSKPKKIEEPKGILPPPISTTTPPPPPAPDMTLTGGDIIFVGENKSWEFKEDRLGDDIVDWIVSDNNITINKETPSQINATGAIVGNTYLSTELRRPGLKQPFRNKQFVKVRMKNETLEKMYLPIFRQGQSQSANEQHFEKITNQALNDILKHTLSKDIKVRNGTTDIPGGLETFLMTDVKQFGYKYANIRVKKIHYEENGSGKINMIDFIIDRK